MSNVKIKADLTEAAALVGTLESLDGKLNTPRHLSAVTNSAYSVMRSAFNIDTAALATLQPEDFYHVYEPGHTGDPTMQLFSVKLRGQSGHRVISWDWKASKVTVPTETGPDGKDRWTGADDKFDREKLHRIHIFVWRAPMMEYGVQVTVRPSLSSRRLLVFPNQEVNPQSGLQKPVFTNKPYTFTPGAEVQGNFTHWFARWWGEGMAEQALQGWTQQRDAAFVRSFSTRMARAKKMGKTMNINFSTEAAREGEMISSLIAGDMEQNYIAAAARRREAGMGDEEH